MGLGGGGLRCGSGRAGAGNGIVDVDFDGGIGARVGDARGEECRRSRVSIVIVGLVV